MVPKLHHEGSTGSGISPKTPKIASGEAARALEPALNCDAALLSPSTGIIDSHSYMLALRGDAEEAGAAYAFHTPLLAAKATGGRFEIDAAGASPMTIECGLLVNAAGLGAPAVARSIDGMPIDLIPRAYLAKGNYFSCSARAPFSHLIYPVPEPGGLGVHLTLDLAGQARFGPDVEWVDTIDYAVVIERIGAELAAKHFGLVEALADHLANMILKEFGAAWVKLSVAKLGALRNAKLVGVTVERKK